MKRYAAIPSKATVNPVIMRISFDLIDISILF